MLCFAECSPYCEAALAQMPRHRYLIYIYARCTMHRAGTIESYHPAGTSKTQILIRYTFTEAELASPKKRPFVCAITLRYATHVMKSMTADLA